MMVRFTSEKIKAVDFTLAKEKNWGGIIKNRVYEGNSLEGTEGHPVIFPNILLLPPHPNIMMHFCVPVDDEHTQIFRCQFAPTENGEDLDQGEIPVDYSKPVKNENGEYHLTTFGSQDAMAWETQGAITNRNRENLGTKDRGIAMFRCLLREQILKRNAG